MPTIPRYQQQADMPSGTGNVPISPDMAALPQKAMGNIGEAIGNVGNTIYKYQEEEARWERAIKAAEIENNLKSDVDAFAESLQGKTAAEIDQLRDDFWASTEQKYGQAYGQDRNLQKTLQAALWKHRYDTERIARIGKAKALTDEAEAQHTILSDSALKEYLAASPEERPTIEADYANRTRDLLNDRSKAEKSIQQFGQKADKALFAGMLENDPQAAERAANDPSMFTRVDAVERATYSKQARKAVEAQQRDIRQAEREQKQAEKEELKAKQEETYNAFVADFTGGKLTRLKVLQSNLDPKEKEHWIAKLDAKAEKLGTGDGSGFKTDKVISAKLYSRIVRDPETVTEDEILDRIGSGLSQSKAEELIKERRTRLKEPKDPGEQAVYDNLKRDRKAGIFGKDQPGDLEYAKQVEAFRTWRKANKDKDPSEYYEKITTPYKQGLIGSWLDFAWPDKVDMKKRRLEMGVQPANAAKDPLGLRR